MGLIMGLLTLPLAPVRGTVWIAERLEEQAQAELNDETALRAQLVELEELRATGEIDEEELEAAEDELVQRLMDLRGFGGEEGYGGIE
jgi:cytochrome c-type biogenesis protein CcmH/NrfG